MASAEGAATPQAENTGLPFRPIGELIVEVEAAERAQAFVAATRRERS